VLPQNAYATKTPVRQAGFVPKTAHVSLVYSLSIAEQNAMRAIWKLLYAQEKHLRQQYANVQQSPIRAMPAADA